MILSGRTARRAVAGAIGAGAIAGATLFGFAPMALAQPPNCTAGDLAQVSAGVSASTSVYLFSHPDVNAFFTGLKGQPKSAIRDDVQNYLNANPGVKGELEGIRAPLIDLKNRCQ
jgi:hemophore-related protein